MRRFLTTQLVQQIRKQADDARSSTLSMPYRVQRIEEFVKELDSGDLKLRVRVLESERAARKATTMYTVFGGTLLNIGVSFSSQGSQLVANRSFIGAGLRRESPAHSRHFSLMASSQDLPDTTSTSLNPVVSQH